MSKETDILDKVRTCLLYINGNGYTEKLSKVYEGYIELASHNEFDTAYYYLGERKPSNVTSDNVPYAWECDLWLHIQLKASSGEGKLIRAIESWIENMRKWLYASQNLAYKAGLTSGKWFTLSVPDALISWQSQTIEKIEPAVIWQDNIAEITFKITFNYSSNT